MPILPPPAVLRLAAHIDVVVGATWTLDIIVGAGTVLVLVTRVLGEAVGADLVAPAEAEEESLVR